MIDYKIIIITILSVFSFGCATHATLVVYSQPEGAQITEIETKTMFGFSPAFIAYSKESLNMNKDINGCFIIKGLEARWVSGAISSVNPIKLCGSNTNQYNITLIRDMELPNIEKDLNFALKVQSIRAQQAQAKAASDAAVYSAFSSIIANCQNNTIHCSTNTVGTQTFTNCR